MSLSGAIRRETKNNYNLHAFDLIGLFQSGRFLQLVKVNYVSFGFTTLKTRQINGPLILGSQGKVVKKRQRVKFNLAKKLFEKVKNLIHRTALFCYHVPIHLLQL